MALEIRTMGSLVFAIIVENNLMMEAGYLGMAFPCALELTSMQNKDYNKCLYRLFYVEAT
jgi:hypothetical protein